MNLVDATFPYPVLTPGKGYINYGICQATASLVPNDDDAELSIECSFEIDDDYIKDFITQGRAVYAIEASCATTYYRNVATSKEPTIIFPVAKADVNGDVEVNMTICAIDSIEDYRNPNAHSAYGNELFCIEPGMILANFGTRILHSDFDYERLTSSSSILRVEDVDDHLGEDKHYQYTFVDLQCDLITICLPHEEFVQYSEISRNPLFLEILHASFVQKALLLALTQMNKYKDENYTWVRVIKYYLDNVKEFSDYKEMLEDEESGLTLQACQELAQAILGNPDLRLINNMRRQQDAMQTAQDED